MPPSDQERSTPAAARQWFTTTHWSAVLTAGRSASDDTTKALGELCQSYWYPLYGYLRRRGYSPEDAQDLTQEFFSRLIDKNYLSSVDPTKGRFRSFLLASLNHFLANEWDKSNAEKRGSGQTILSLNDEEAEGRYRMEPMIDHSPEKIFDRGWAIALLDRVLARLRDRYVASKKGGEFELLKSFLGDAPGSGDYAEVSGQLGITGGAVAVRVHRLRQDYREMVREEVARTVTNPQEVDDEMRYLFVALND